MRLTIKFILGTILHVGYHSSDLLDLTCANAPTTLRKIQLILHFFQYAQLMEMDVQLILHAILQQQNKLEQKMHKVLFVFGIKNVNKKHVKMLLLHIILMHYNKQLNIFICTVRNRICSNALTPNEDCEMFLPDNNCITKSEGDVLLIQHVKLLQLSKQSTVDANGPDCFLRLKQKRIMQKQNMCKCTFVLH